MNQPENRKRSRRGKESQQRAAQKWIERRNQFYSSVLDIQRHHILTDSEVDDVFERFERIQLLKEQMLSHTRLSIPIEEELLARSHCVYTNAESTADTIVLPEPEVCVQCEPSKGPSDDSDEGFEDIESMTVAYIQDTVLSDSDQTVYDIVPDFKVRLYKNIHQDFSSAALLELLSVRSEVKETVNVETNVSSECEVNVNTTFSESESDNSESSHFNECNAIYTSAQKEQLCACLGGTDECFSEKTVDSIQKQTNVVVRALRRRRHHVRTKCAIINVNSLSKRLIIYLPDTVAVPNFMRCKKSPHYLTNSFEEFERLRGTKILVSHWSVKKRVPANMYIKYSHPGQVLLSFRNKVALSRNGYCVSVDAISPLASTRVAEKQ